MVLYILGGRQKKRFVRRVKAENRFEAALIIRLDTDTGTSDRVVEYQTPPGAKAHQESSNLFTSGTLCANRLFVCTYTEVLVLELPEFRRLAYISMPCFNSVHHVSPTLRGTLLIANTGLDMVVEITLDGKLLREWNVLGEGLWSRFSEHVDYRRVATTKPHHSHPNFVFELQDDVWVTRFYQRDAICLTNSKRRIHIGIERPHDGVLADGLLYFTTVDSHLVVVDPISENVLSTLDLKEFRGDTLPGPAWCRGVLVVNKEMVWVGFTRILKTWTMGGLNWVKHGFRELDAPTHVSLFDLSKKQCVKSINLESHGINILFSILSAESNVTLEPRSL
jgi:hypothetical protein